MEISVSFDDAVVDYWQLNERKIKEAVALLLYHKGEVTMGAAANIIGCSKTEFDALMRENKIYFNYGQDEVASDLDKLDQLFKA